MSKRLYNIGLHSSNDKQSLINELSCELFDELTAISDLVTYNLTEDSAASLELDARISFIETVGNPDEECMPPGLISGAYSQSGFQVAGYADVVPISSNDGRNYKPGKVLYDTNLSRSGGSYNLVGIFSDEDRFLNSKVMECNFDGSIVDIVTLEVNSSSRAQYPGYETHPDFCLPGTTTTRMVAMNWGQFSSDNTPQNNQITNNSFSFFNHPIGVLSNAGGTYSGWAKGSSLRVIYNELGYATHMNAIFNWHNQKAVNPTTGVRNATIIIGEHQWSYALVRYWIPIESINQIEYYDEQGTMYTAYRPPGGWFPNLKLFYDQGFTITTVSSGGTYIWAVAVHNRLGVRWATYDSVANSIPAGCYHFKAGGNDGLNTWRQGDPRVNNRIYYDACTAVVGIDQTLDWFNYQGTTISLNAGSLRSNISYETGNNNEITVGAYQSSDRHNIPDWYSHNGNAIDIWGQGSNCYSAYPKTTDNRGYRWGGFGGTSGATPNVVGVAAVTLHWFWSREKRWPSRNELLDLLKGQQFIEEEKEGQYFNDTQPSNPVIDWTNAPSANDVITTARLKDPYTFALFYMSAGNGFGFGGRPCTESPGGPLDKVTLPFKVARGPGYKITTAIKNDHYDRPDRGQLYPRRKLKHT